MTVQCYICGQLKAADEWDGIIKPVNRSGASGYSHGLCPECYELEKTRIAKEVEEWQTRKLTTN